MSVRAITLTQPYASLVACGEKRIETRSWRHPYRGALAIHAAVGLEPVGGMRGLIDLLEAEQFAAALRPHISGYTPEERAADLPRGMLIAIVTLIDVIPVEQLAPVLMDRYGIEWAEMAEREAPLGDYRPGRYAWLMNHRINLYDGIPCKGALGVWKLPKEALATVVAAVGEDVLVP